MSDTAQQFLFAHGGMLQSERLEQVPDPDSMQVSGRTFEDLVGRAAEFARSVIYYGDDNKPDGDWCVFFKDVYDYDNRRVRTEVIEDMVRNSSVPPHLALLFAFFRMSLVTQQDMNTLTGRQLDFYFREILGFRMRKGSEGHVTVFAELGRNVDSVSIEKGLLFDAGKDGDGKMVTYESVDELRLGKEEVAALANYSPQEGFIMESLADTDSVAGMGTGSGTDSASSEDKGNKTHALCIAAKISEIPGCDTTFTFSNCQETERKAFDSLRVEYTSSEGWVAFDKSGKAGELHISASMPPVACYDPQVHGEGLDTSFPVIRFVSDKGYGPLSQLNPTHFNKVGVTIHDFVPRKLKNKYGEVDNIAGVNPFGPDGKQDDWFEVPLPFDDPKPEMDPISLNDNSVLKEETEDQPKNRFTILNGNCDQATLSKEYADLVMKAYTGNSKEKSEAKTALANKKISAVFPRLLSPAKVKSASGEYDADNVFLQHPCGTDLVTGKATLTAHSDLAEQIAFLAATAPESGTGRSAAQGNEADGNGSALFIALSQTGPHAGQISLYLDNSGEAEGPGLVQWSYRGKDGWVDFNKSAILKDTTCGLSQSGIVVFDCKQPLPAGNGGFLGGLACIRCVCSNSNCLYVKKAIPRAVELAFSESSAGIGPGGAPLPKGTISKAVHSVVGVKAFSQQYDGDSGIRAEDSLQFRRRVAERLRHKGRAWSAWDYETLILERFADISFVKCLPSCKPDGTAAPGHVTVIIIPQSPDDMLKPAPRNKLVNDVDKYLNESVSRFARIHVMGPSYHEVSVRASVSLRPGYNDATKYDALTQKALSDYLRPWVGYADGRRFKDGDGVSDIIAFMESLPFVDVIEELTVSVDGKVVGMDGKIERTSAVEVLTSAPAHDVKCHTAD